MADFMEISIIDVAIKCGIKLVDCGKAEVTISCPFCDDKKKHMCLNTAKNVFYCHRCGESGNAISLYAKLTGADNKVAYRELTDGGIVRTTTVTHKQITNVERVPLPLSGRHSVYTGLLQSLDLSAKHRNNLLNRGLDADVIESNLYRTVPGIAAANRIATELATRFPLAGVPGFYTKDGIWMMSLYKGFFIPVRSADGLIQGLQIRLDDEKKRKYRWFSSSHYKENGTPAHSWIHITDSGGNAVFITEGALKADVAAHLTGDCFIGLSGANCINGLVPLLSGMGITKVYEALDMDKHTNKNVATATDKLHRRLAEVGINCIPCEWDSHCKGIDDFLLNSTD